MLQARDAQMDERALEAPQKGAEKPASDPAPAPLQPAFYDPTPADPEPTAEETAVLRSPAAGGAARLNRLEPRASNHGTRPNRRSPPNAADGAGG